MSLVWMDGFDAYGTDNPLTNRYTTGGTPTLVSPGRFGGSGQYLKCAGAGGPSAAFTAAATLAFGFAFRLEAGSLANASTGAAILQALNGSTVIGQLGVTSTGALKWGRGDFTTNNVAASADSLVADATWHYVEVEFTRNASTGAVNIWLDGVQVATASAANTGASDIDHFKLTGFASGNLNFDDLYVRNTASKLGECRIEFLKPSADTAQKDFTPSTGVNNFACVDDIPMNGDTDYVSSAVAGAKDIYDLSNLSYSPTAIFAVQSVMMARKDDTAARTMRANIKSGSTTANGATRTLATTYGVFADIYETDPATAAAWTLAGVNGLQAGIEVV